MRWFRADLHIHSVLSPCGDLDMSPLNIIKTAKEQKLDFIAISDHNSTYHASLMMELGRREGVVVFPGVEISTREEIHCLCLFETLDQINEIQCFLDEYSMQFPNNPEKFGLQLVVDEKEKIIKYVDDLLIVGLNVSIEQVELKVHELGGVFILAHVDRMVHSIYAQLGFIPLDLHVDAIEFSSQTTKEKLIERKPELKKYSLISNSDAHTIDSIGNRYSEYFLEEISFPEFKKALANEGERTTRTCI